MQISEDLQSYLRAGLVTTADDLTFYDCAVLVLQSQSHNNRSKIAISLPI